MYSVRRAGFLCNALGITWSCLVAESDHYVLTATGVGGDSAPVPFFYASDSTDRWGRVSPVARIHIMALKRSLKEKKREEDDFPHKQTWLFRHCKYVPAQYYSVWNIFFLICTTGGIDFPKLSDKIINGRREIKQLRWKFNSHWYYWQIRAIRGTVIKDSFCVREQSIKPLSWCMQVVEVHITLLKWVFLAINQQRYWP